MLAKTGRLGFYFVYNNNQRSFESDNDINTRISDEEDKWKASSDGFVERQTACSCEKVGLGMGMTGRGRSGGLVAVSVVDRARTSR